MPKKLAITVLLLLVGIPVASAKTGNINQEPLHGQLGDTKVEVIIGDTTPDYIVLWSENTALVTTNPGTTSGGGGGGSSVPTNTIPITKITPVIPIISTPLAPSEVVTTPSDTPNTRDNTPTTPGQPAVAPPTNTDSGPPTSNSIPTTHSSSPSGIQEATAPATKEPPLSNPLTELRSTITELQKTVDSIIQIHEQAAQDKRQHIPQDLIQTSANLHGAAPPRTNTLLDWFILLILALSAVTMYNNGNFFLKKIINKNTHDHAQNKN